MATRTALLNGNVINRDVDFSKHIEAVSEPGVISGFAVTSSSVAVGEAFVKCERTNGDVVYALVYNTEAQSISGDGDVYIEVSQSIIDNGELGNEDGSGIAEIKVGTMPATNCLKLATISSGTVTDQRNMIKKVGELKTSIDTNTANIADLDERVEELEEAGAINHLEESGLVGELYTLSDNLIKQKTPELVDCTLNIAVGDVDADKQIHIQRLGSGVASNKLKLKVKSVGTPTQDLVVEVRKGVQVTVTADEEAYWYGDELVCSGNISYGSITSTYAEIEVTMDGDFGETKGEKLDVVVYQANNTVSASNYYCIGCDRTQYSEGFSYVAVNGATRVRYKLMPYCISNGFGEWQLVKADKPDVLQTLKSYSSIYVNDSYSQIYEGEMPYPGKIKITCRFPSSGSVRLKVNGTTDTTYSTVYGMNTFISSSYIQKGSTISVEARLSAGSTYIEQVDISAVIYPMSIKYIVLVPYESKNIGQLATAFLGGNNSEGVYVGGYMMSTSESATTGSITLGNAVGYITVNLNGQIVKIPYYGN